MAASSMWRSMPSNRAFTVTTTYDTVNITWAITIVMKPVLKFSVRNMASSEAPSTTSGEESGMKTKKSIVVRPRKR